MTSEASGEGERSSSSRRSTCKNTAARRVAQLDGDARRQAAELREVLRPLGLVFQPLLVMARARVAVRSATRCSKACAAACARRCAACIPQPKPMSRRQESR